MKQNRNKLSPFGFKVRSRLNELNMTQKELAERIGFNENYLTDIMRGRRPGHKYREEIEKQLGIEAERYPISV